MVRMKNFLKKIVVWLLTLEARILLKRFNPKIVAITGSVGKTSTKDAVFTVLAGTYKVRKSDKSFNSDIGVPLTILGIKNPWANPLKWLAALYEGFTIACFSHEYPEWLVLEVGADHPGDIGRITRWLKPDIAVLTAVPDVPVHVEFFPSVADVLKEKRKLVDACKPDGAVIIDGTCQSTAQIAEGLLGTVYTYGFTKNCFTQVTDARVLKKGNDLIGMSYVFSTKSNEYEIVLDGTLGVHHAYPIAVAVTVGEYQGLSQKNIESRLSAHDGPPGRMRIIAGINESTLIDDTYNSSPEATKAALVALKDVHVAGKKIAVLGDMSELGKHAPEAHTKIGIMSVPIVDELITVGARARTIAEAARLAGKNPATVHEFGQGEWDSVAARLKELIQPGDIVLAKGSQSTRMEKVVIQLLRDTAEANKLVRQDEEWRHR
jgi:UDP-N-acetylmuramoyl-tripeptide--D-alanyl-D-alanine ligase